jgi:hypothetical protein
MNQNIGSASNIETTTANKVIPLIAIKASNRRKYANQVQKIHKLESIIIVIMCFKGRGSKITVFLIS